MTPPRNPVAYAEQDLGVHAVHTNAETLNTELEAAQAVLAGFTGRFRQLREDIADREAQVTVIERGANAEMSATAFEPHLRVAKQTDPELVALRRSLIETQDAEDVQEKAVVAIQRRLDVAVARMTELGGLLQFYAAVKLTIAMDAQRAANATT